MTAVPKKPKAGKEVVYVDHDDEITSIIEKVEVAKQKIVALVLPKRFMTLQSVVNMRLLKRSADNGNKTVVLITSESALLPLAGVAGLHVAKNLQSKPAIPPSPLVSPDDELPEEPADPDEQILDKEAKLDYHRSIGELASTHGDEPQAINLDGKDDGDKAAASKTPKDKKLKVPNFDRFRLLIIAGIAGLIALVAFIVFATRVMPEAVVTVRTSSTPVSANLRLSASDKIDKLDEEKGEIPAELKKSDQTATQQVQATGQNNKGEKATGNVKLSIACSGVSGSPPKVPAGTGVTASGLTFITQKTAELDNAEFSAGCRFTDTVSVNAQQPGTKYNIAPSSFSVNCSPPTCSSGISGSSSAAMTGGTDNIVTVVSQADLDNAKKKITAADSDKFSKDFEKKLGAEGFFVLSSTLKLGDPVVIANPAIGQEATNVSVSIKINHSVLAVSKSDLEKVVEGALTKELDKSKQDLVDEDVLENADISVINQTSPTSVGLDLTVEAAAVPIINLAQLKQQIGGKKESEIKKIVSAWPGVRNVDVEMSPFWVSKAPKSTSKLTIKLEKAN